MDKPLADVLLEFSGGIVRLIEFKNKKSKHKKEREKHDRVQHLMIDEALKGAKEHFRGISEAIHWFVETDPKGNNLISRIVPYLDAYPRKTHSQYTFEEFVQLTADDAVNKQNSFPQKDLSDYLYYIAKLQIGENKQGNENKIPEVAGVLLWINSSGGIKIAELPDIMHLKLQHREYIQQMQYRQDQEFVPKKSETNHVLKETQALRQKPENEHNLRRTRGLSL